MYYLQLNTKKVCILFTVEYQTPVLIAKILPKVQNNRFYWAILFSFSVFFVCEIFFFS